MTTDFSLPRAGQLVVFDTEFTAWEGSQAREWSGPGEHREVIQIGAVCVDCGAEYKVHAALSLYVVPTINPKLSSYIQDLTGITQAQLSRDGMTFADAYARFVAFCGSCPILSWGRDDEVLLENLRLNRLEPQLPASQFVNLRRLTIDRHGIGFQSISSANLPELFGSSGAVNAHDALEDARAVAAVLPAMAEAGMY